MNGFEFMIKMKDYASSGVQQLAEGVGLADRKVDQLNSSMGKTEKTSNILGNSMGKLKRIVAGAFAVGSIFLFTNKVIGARAEYEKFQAVLTNTFQSSAIGDGALNLLTDFAQKTPFQLNELSDSFVKLVNRGFTPAKEQLTQLGDLAASQGKGFGQLSEAVLDAETNEFERLKEFGIKASKAGDQVSFSFKGITKTVKNNATSIREAILEYGGMTGVAGSMESISKTLGGRISNLKDQWWSFLVAVGGQSEGIFASSLGYLTTALSFLTDNLANISTFFEALWHAVKPVAISIWDLTKALLGFTGTNDLIKVFGNVMMVTLTAVDLLATGVVTLIDWLMPFADIIGVVTGAWTLFNLAVSVSPVGWIVIGITALVGALGFLVKYVDFTGFTWKKVWDNAGLIFNLWVQSVKLQYTTMYQGIEIGLSKIQLSWYKFKNSVGLGNKSENNEMISQINASVEARKKIITNGANQVIELGKKLVNGVGIKIDTQGIKSDFQGIKDKFSGGSSVGNSSAYTNFLKNKGVVAAGGNSSNNKGAKAGSSIVSGGAKKTNITISIGKLTEDVNIHVSSAEKGISDLGEKIKEEMLRVINSVNQIQTT